MFKKLKDKIAEEVKISPQRLQQFTQSVTDKLQSNGNDDNVFSITEEEVPTTPQPSSDPGFTNVSLHATGSIEPRIRRNSNSSMASDVSFLPRYEPSISSYHLQSDLDISASELEDNASTSSQLGHVSKEQVYSAFQKAQMRYHKYRGRYTDLANHYKEMEREIAKMKAVLVETQDKAIRRTSELREQCTLSQKAKADLEQALRTEIEEKQIVISTLQDKINLLQNNKPDPVDTSELENLKGKIQEMKANTIIYQTKEAEQKEKIANLEKNLFEVEEREKSNNLKFAKSKMELHTEIENKEIEISGVKKELENVRKELETAEGKQGQNLKAQNAKLIEKCETLSTKCQNYESELLKVEQYKLEIAGLQKERSELRKKCEEVESGNTKLVADFEKHKLELEAVVAKSREEIEGYRIKLEETDKLEAEFNKVGDYEKRLSEIEFEKNDLNAKLVDCTKTIEEYKTKCEELKQENIKLFDDYKNRVNELELKLSSYEEQLQTQKDLELKLTEANKKLSQENHNFKEELGKHLVLNDEVGVLKNQVKTLKESESKLIKEIENYNQKLQIETENVIACKNQIQSLQSENETYKNKLDESNLKLKSHQEDILKIQETTKQSLLSLESKIKQTVQADYKKKEEDLHNDFERKLNELRVNDEDVKQTQIKLMRSQEKVEQLTANLKHLTEQFEHKISAYAELETNHLGLIEENNGREVEIHELKKECKLLSDELERLKREVLSLDKTVCKKNDEVTSLEETVREKIEEMANLEKSVVEIKEESLRYQKLFDEKSEEVANFKKLVSEVDEEVLDLQKLVDSKNEEVSNLQKVINEKNEDILNLQKFVNEKNKEVSSLQSLKEEVSSLQKLVNEKCEEISTLNKSLDEKNEEVLSLQKLLDEKNNEVVHLQKLAHEKNDEINERIKSEKEQILVLEKTLEEKNKEINNLSQRCGEISTLKEQVLKSENEIILKEKQIYNYEDEIIPELNEIKQKLKEKTIAVENLEKMLKEKNLEHEADHFSLQHDNEFLRVNINELSNRCRHLEEEFKKRKNELAEVLTLNSDLEQRSLRGEKEISELLDLNNKKVDENVQLMEKLQSALKLNEALGSQLEESERIRDEAQRKFEENLAEEVFKLNGNADEFKVKFDSIQKERDELAAAVEETSKLKAKLVVVEKEKEEMQTLVNEMRKFEVMYSEVLNDNNNVCEELKTTKQQYSNLSEEIKRLKEDLVNLDFYKDSSSKLNDELNQIRSALDKTSSEKQKLQSECERLKLVQTQYNDLVNTNESSSDRLLNLDAEISKMHLRNSEISTDNQNLIKENDHLLTECMELKTKYENFDVLKTQLNEKISILNCDNENAKTEIEKLNETNKTLRDQLSKLVDNTQSDDLHTKISELHEKYVQVSEENEGIKKTLNEYKNKHDLIQAERNRLETQFYDLEKHCGELIHEKQLLRDEIDELKTSPINLTNGNKEVDNLREKLAQYKSIDATNRSSIEFYENEMQKLRNKNEKLNRKLDETLVTLNHCADLSSSTEIEYLKNVLYNYMLGKESLVMARVLAAVCKFDTEMTDAVLKHEQHKQSLLGQFGIL